VTGVQTCALPICRRESSLFMTFWIPAFAGMTKRGYFSKLSVGKGK
jgi:hypothetical protein